MPVFSDVSAEPEIAYLRRLSNQLRSTIIDVHRRAGAGHLGSSLSIVEALVVLFQEHFNWQQSPEESWRGDRFILSKGHAALGLYCALSMEGQLDPQRLSSFGQNGSTLESHPNENLEPAIHASTGSLGQGLSIGVGLALGSRLRGSGDRVFVVIGDGETNEGQIWEAARCAVKLKLNNLVVLLDDNQMQQDGPTPDIMPVPDISTCWREMGWRILECDGHDCAAISTSLSELLQDPAATPKLLHLHSIKGRGIPFLEGRTESHFPAPLSNEDFLLVKYMMDQGV
jgi:transketolase